MHTTEGSKVRFFHNSDFSGMVQVADKTTGKTIVEIPFSDFKKLVAKSVRNERISTLEQLDDDAVLGLTKPD